MSFEENPKNRKRLLTRIRKNSSMSSRESDDETTSSHRADFYASINLLSNMIEIVSKNDEPEAVLPSSSTNQNNRSDLIKEIDDPNVQTEPSAVQSTSQPFQLSNLSNTLKLTNVVQSRVEEKDDFKTISKSSKPVNLNETLNHPEIPTDVSNSGSTGAWKDPEETTESNTLRKALHEEAVDVVLPMFPARRRSTRRSRLSSSRRRKSASLTSLDRISVSSIGSTISYTSTISAASSLSELSSISTFSSMSELPSLSSFASTISFGSSLESVISNPDYGAASELTKGLRNKLVHQHSLP